MQIGLATSKIWCIYVLLHTTNSIVSFQILPLYKELHAYVRSKLQAKHPEHIHPEGGLPAHLLGEVTGQGAAFAPTLLEQD